MSKLYVVATPIGNADDISLRALKVLQEVDIVICEEWKEGSKLLKRYQIKKPLENLNEHNENDKTKFLVEKIIHENLDAALISDAGTPLFADPGNQLVEQCRYYNIPVVPIPGVSSIMTALMASGLPLQQFIFWGFLPANKLERLREIKKIPHNFDVIFLEAPYRLKPFLRDLKKSLSGRREAIVAYKLTQPEEKFFFGTISELQVMTENLPKGEFVFILKKYAK